MAGTVGDHDDDEAIFRNGKGVDCCGDGSVDLLAHIERAAGIHFLMSRRRDALYTNRLLTKDNGCWEG